MNKQEISFEERKAIQLEMLKEVDSFCKKNQIRYSLAFGTLLGAVRHKGYIPWDDDVDIMMPLPDMQRFKQLFRSDNLKYCDVDTEQHFDYPFSRIVHRATYNQRFRHRSTYGICIDLYPIVNLPDSPDGVELFFNSAKRLGKLRGRYKQWQHRINSRFSVGWLPGYDCIMKRSRDYLLGKSLPYGSTSTFFIIAGPNSIRHRLTYDHDIFASVVNLPFEGVLLPCISDYDYFLTLRYDDWHQLPPEEDRMPYHGGHYYWK